MQRFADAFDETLAEFEDSRAAFRGIFGKKTAKTFRDKLTDKEQAQVHVWRGANIYIYRSGGFDFRFGNVSQIVVSNDPHSVGC